MFYLLFDELVDYILNWFSKLVVYLCGELIYGQHSIHAVALASLCYILLRQFCHFLKVFKPDGALAAQDRRRGNAHLDLIKAAPG